MITRFKLAFTEKRRTLSNTHHMTHIDPEMNRLGPEREEEIKTLNFAFVNQNYPPKQVLKTIQEYQESDGSKEENKSAEERTESIVVPYIKVYQRNSAEMWVKKT